MQRNKLTRPLGFGEKAFHEQELKKKNRLAKMIQLNQDWKNPINSLLSQK